MNNLPTTRDSSTSSTPVPPPVGSFAKEQEGPQRVTESSFGDIGKEMELPKEVTAAGVKVRPTTVSIPPPVKNLGVKVAGSQTPFTPNTTTLPLSDVQIAEGLHANISNSIRWLAEWCKYNLKKLGLIQ